MVKLANPLSPGQEGFEGIQSLISQNVVVLAQNFSLSEAQLNLLNRGLTFIPSIEIGKDHKEQFKFDLQNYHRKLQLALYFKNTKKDKITPFVLPSFWVPPQDKLPPQIKVLIKKDKKTLQKYFRPYREKPNLSQDEREALRDLIDNKYIVIKPADKGSAVVIMNRQQYVEEGYRQLSDERYYKKLEKPIYLETVPIIHNILDQLKRAKFINEKQNSYLKGEIQPRPRRFYMLPKIHKPPETWPVPFRTPPGRPIVSDCGSETYRVADYVDYFLNPLSVKHASYVKDTYHFIEIIKKLTVPPNSLFFTMDIDSMYTNIDTRAGLAAVQNIFQLFPDPKRPDEQILKLLEINLTKNDFEFNGEFFLQIKGTAMGKKFSPAYANIFMAHWETQALAKCVIKPLQYLRYLDDIWGIWIGTLDQFREFHQVLNTHDPSIKLKYEVHEQFIHFLDTTVYKGSSYNETHKLDVKVHFKETDTHALLFKTSFHPNHTHKGLVKSQLLRFRRICTQDEDFRAAVKILFMALRKRGYSRTYLRKCFKSFQQQKPADREEIIPLITTFSSLGTAINYRLKDNFQTFIGSQNILPNYRIISAYRRNNNLRDLLVQAKLKSLRESSQRQNFEEKFYQLKYVQNRVNKQIYKVSQRFNWSSKNCVYMIFCAKCGNQYIGETKNSISRRMTQHRYNIKHQKNTNILIVRHFILHGLQSVRVTGIQGNSFWSDWERKKWERRWIYWLNTKEPFGLNQQ